MITVDNILIATPLSRLISGAVRSSDVTSADKLNDKLVDTVKSAIAGKGGTQKPKASEAFNFKAISEALTNPDDKAKFSLEKQLANAEKLLNNTDVNMGGLVVRLEEVKEFLRQALPVNEYTDVLGLHSTDPSVREQLQFKRMYDAIDNPMGVVKRIKDNSFTQDEIRTVETVFPEFFEFVQLSITDELIEQRAGGNETIGAVQSTAIKRFFGEPVARPDVAEVLPEEEAGGAKFDSNAPNRTAPESGGESELF